MGLPDRSWAKRLLDHTSRGLLALHVLLGLYMLHIPCCCCFC